MLLKRPLDWPQNMRVNSDAPVSLCKDWSDTAMRIISAGQSTANWMMNPIDLNVVESGYAVWSCLEVTT